jgi:2'-5' RNA ligase
MLSSRLQEIASGREPFPIALGRLGCFPNIRNPRVLWVGIIEGTEPLAGLARLIDTACNQLGFAPEDKPFRPHLTIARAGFNGHSGLNLDDHVTFQSRATVSSYALIESKLLPTGAQYRAINHFELGKPGHD